MAWAPNSKLYVGIGKCEVAAEGVHDEEVLGVRRSATDEEGEEGAGECPSELAFVHRVQHLQIPSL